MSDFSDDDLRAAFRSLGDAPQTNSDLNPNEVWEVVSGGGSTKARRALVDHIATDPEGAWLWRLAQELQTEVQTQTPLPTPISSSKLPLQALWRRVMPPLALATSVAGLLFLWREPRPAPNDSIYRAGSRVEISSRVSEIINYDSDGLILEWGEVKDANSYSIRVVNVSLEEIWVQDQLLEPKANVPAKNLEENAVEGTLFWQVTAHFHSSMSSIRSQTFVTKIVKLVPKPEK